MDTGDLQTFGMNYPTPVGLAHLAVDLPFSQPRCVLVLGHGAGGDIEAADLLAARGAALSLDVAVVRVRQPYRVAGRRAPAPAAQLDVAFSAVVALLMAADSAFPFGSLPVVVGGRSSGARVAARVAGAVDARGVLALAFPLIPPGRPLSSRIGELVGIGVPTLVVQGSRDPFGSAADVRTAIVARSDAHVEVAEVADADHSFRTRRSDPTTSAQSLAAVGSTVAGWLSRWTEHS